MASPRWGDRARPRRPRLARLSVTTCRPTTSRASLDSFVGRADAIIDVSAALANTRLLTLTGVGGTGKTRLAVETASRLGARFADGVWLAELAPVTQPNAVPYVVADVIGAVQQPGKTMAESVVDSLRHRAVLLILDNCEHMLDAAASLVSVVAMHCPAVRIIATSREGLAIRGERVMQLQSLSDQDGAVLFADRAQATGSTHGLKADTLARLSACLDGIPLAIELAAARCRSMSPEEVEQRLDDRFRLLRGSRRGRVERHQTLRNTVAWSYELLDDVQRRVFDRLSVFAGGFTLDAAAAVAGADDVDPLDVEDAIAALVDQSMVLASDTDAGTRYRLLEMLRQFGEERLLDAGEAAAIRGRHVAWFADFMRQAWQGLWSSDDVPWILGVHREFENLRAAVYAAIANEDRAAVGTLFKPLPLWAWQALKYEVRDWAEAALEMEPEPPHVRAVAVWLRSQTGGRIDDATRLAQGWDRSQGTDLDEACLQACARLFLALSSQSAEVDEAGQRMLEAARRTGNRPWAAHVMALIATLLVIMGRSDEARRAAVEALESAEQTGNSTALNSAYWAMGYAHSETDPELALRYLDRAVEVSDRQRLLVPRNTALAVSAKILVRMGDLDRARLRLFRALRSFIRSGDFFQLWALVDILLSFLVQSGRVDDAKAIWAGLAARPSPYSIPQYRAELRDLLGEPGESELSDGDMLASIRRVLDDLDGDNPETNRTESTT